MVTIWHESKEKSNRLSRNWYIVAPLRRLASIMALMAFLFVLDHDDP